MGNMGCVKTVGDMVCELEGLGLCAKMCRPTGAWSEIPDSARASGEDMVVALSESNGNIHPGTDVYMRSNLEKEEEVGEDVKCVYMSGVCISVSVLSMRLHVCADCRLCCDLSLLLS